MFAPSTVASQELSVSETEPQKGFVTCVESHIHSLCDLGPIQPVCICEWLVSGVTFLDWGMKWEDGFQCLAQPEFTASVCGVNQLTQQGLGACSRPAEQSRLRSAPVGSILFCSALPSPHTDLNEQNPECSGSAGSFSKDKGIFVLLGCEIIPEGETV